jgi:restriction endonuclease S subunit
MTIEPIEAAIQQFPKDWRVARICDVATVNGATLTESTDPDYVFDYIDISTVSSLGEVGEPERLRFADAPSRARRIVRDGDILVSTVRTYLRAIARIENAEDVIASTGFAVITPGGDINADFLYWWLRSHPLVEQIVAQSVGVSYPAINSSEVAHMAIPLPDSTTQQRIADYLDRECSRIDDILAEQRRLSDLLNDRKQSVITSAVTGQTEMA